MSKRKAGEALANDADQQTDDVGEFPPQTSQAEGAAAQPTLGPVRSWSQRHTGPVRYHVLTDSRINKIVIKFNLAEGEKTPPDEVLAVMRAAKANGDGSPTGLKFEDSRLHGKVWTLPSDPEGRAILAAIQTKLDELGAQPDPAQEPAR